MTSAWRASLCALPLAGGALLVRGADSHRLRRAAGTKCSSTPRTARTSAPALNAAVAGGRFPLTCNLHGARLPVFCNSRCKAGSEASAVCATHAATSSLRNFDATVFNRSRQTHALKAGERAVVVCRLISSHAAPVIKSRNRPARTPGWLDTPDGQVLMRTVMHRSRRSPCRPKFTFLGKIVSAFATIKTVSLSLSMCPCRQRHAGRIL